jgi:hypothetical protein
MDKRIKFLKNDLVLLVIGITVFLIIPFQVIQIKLKETLAQEGNESLVDIFRKNSSEARIKANEEVAVVNCGIIHYACWAYYNVWEQFPSSLKELGDRNPPYIDPRLAKATLPDKAYQGYFYIYERPDPQHFTLVVKPKVVNVTGKNIFFVDDSGKVRLDDVNGAVIKVVDKP